MKHLIFDLNIFYSKSEVKDVLSMQNAKIFFVRVIRTLCIPKKFQRKYAFYTINQN